MTDINTVAEAHEEETKVSALLRSVKSTEEKLRKEGKLVTLQIGTALIETTCPEKYESLIL
ncbi:hypothetical protein [Parabacteroides provencensis]|uniref:hypothetical protein n=1 Tax=Parabacteroides provencensis TaxID=1944636 RepID=UPI000C15540C|nr:hypothetical protein [Parabacteroides provencensis]